jgi:serine protease Do
MKRNILKMAGLAALVLSMGLSGSAQAPAKTESKAKAATPAKPKTSTYTTISDSDDDDREQIIIRRKGNKDVKVVVEVKNGEVKVNGKPVSEFKDDNVTITKSKVMVYDGRAIARVPRAAGSPYRSGTWSFDNGDVMELHGLSNKGFLGVVTEKDNGAKIKEITKGSAAEKAGFKEGDVIVKVDDTKIEGPEDLSQAIGNHKPG